MEVTIASGCYELDYKILLISKYGEKHFCKKAGDVFSQRLLLINNVNDQNEVVKLAERAKQSYLFDEYLWVSEIEEKAIESLGKRGVSRDSFREKNNLVGNIRKIKNGKKPSVYSDGYISSIPAICALYACKTDYLLYLDDDAVLIGDTADSFSWINDAITIMEQDKRYVVANPIWNKKYNEAKRESIYELDNFYVSQGFSNQCFMVNAKRVRTEFDFNEKTNKKLVDKYPSYAGNCFERRFATYMYNHGLYRLTAKTSNYIHKDFTKNDSNYWLDLDL